MVVVSKVKEQAEDMEVVISLKPETKIGTLVVAEDKTREMVKIREMVNAEGFKEEIRIPSKTNNFSIYNLELRHK